MRVLSAFGQSNYAVVTGTVTDPHHLPVVGAKIQLTAASTGAIRHVLTNQQGLFDASALLPDDYELTTEAPELRSGPNNPFGLEVGQKLGGCNQPNHGSRGSKESTVMAAR